MHFQDTDSALPHHEPLSFILSCSGVDGNSSNALQPSTVTPISAI